MSALLQYECRVPVNGYEVITIEVELKDKDDDVFTEKWRVLQPKSERTRRVDLFKNSSAFLEFAQTPATEDGIKGFADRYGPLFPDLGPGSSQYGQSISGWSSHIKTVRRTVELWNAGNFGKIIRALQKFIGVDLTNLMELDPVNDLHAVPVYLLLKGDPSSASPRLCIRPESLAHALWAQLVLAIDGNVNLDTCKHCRKLFTLKAGQGRSDKEYCSNACRMRAYRKRKGSG